MNMTMSHLKSENSILLECQMIYKMFSFCFYLWTYYAK